MKYMGGKSKIAKEIVPIIQRHIEARGTGKYIEPFVGGANIIDKVECESRVGLDINRYLIALFNHIQSGGELPQTITREEYSKVRAARDQYPDRYVGCVGFLASYNGRFFDGGYSGTVKTKTGLVRDYYNEARNNLLQQSAHLQGVSFGCSDYRELEFENCVIYCDPPYSGTKQYNNTRFNSSEFWEIMRRWSENNTVLISEQTAPEDFECIWEKRVIRTQGCANTIRATEKLFKYSGKGGKSYEDQNACGIVQESGCVLSL